MNGRTPYPHVAPDAAPESAPTSSDCRAGDGLGGMDAETVRTFDRLCRMVSSRGRGLSLPELGGCHHLARLLAATPRDPDAIASAACSLNIDPEDLT